MPFCKGCCGLFLVVGHPQTTRRLGGLHEALLRTWCIAGTFDTLLGTDAAPSLLLALQYNPANVTVLTQAI